MWGIYMVGVNSAQTMFNNLITFAVLIGIGYFIYQRSQGNTPKLNFDMKKYTKFHRK